MNAGSQVVKQTKTSISAAVRGIHTCGIDSNESITKPPQKKHTSGIGAEKTALLANYSMRACTHGET